MADILLTHGYFLNEDAKEQEIMKPYVPLGLLYLCAYLKKQSFSVDIFDSTFGDRDALYALLETETPGILGLYTNLMTRASVVEIATRARASGWRVIVGGPESANYPLEYLRHGAEFVVMGEGEQTTAELLAALADGSDLHQVHGLAFLAGDELVRTPERAMLANLSDYPWPARDAIDLQPYFDAWRTHHGGSSISMITARGCPYKCTWCSHAVFGYNHKKRDPVECADELQHIVETYNPDEIWYADDVFTINHKWLFKYAEQLRERGLKVPFETISRADRMLDERVMDTLAEMGCYRVWIGAESGSQRLLDEMKRGVTVSQVKQATQAAQARNIEVGIFLMWGFGSEQLVDIDETVVQIADINPDIFFTTVAYPIKGTEFYDNKAEVISSDKAWMQSTDRDLKIGTQQSPRYYRFANRYLKSHVASTRLHQSNPALARIKARHASRARSILESGRV